MRTTVLWLLAVLALAGCGGNGTPATEQPAAAAPPAATQQSPAAAEATADASDPAAVAVTPPQPAPSAVAEIAGAPTTGKFQLGTHYQRLSPAQPTSSNPDQVEVAEVFWYGCPHCFAFDPTLKSWLAHKPEYVNFIRIPAVWNDTLKIHARAFYTAEALGKGAELHDPLFKEIHEKGARLDTEESLQEFFGRFGVDAAAFKAAFDSFAVHAKMQRADELNRRYRVASVPMIVINGKYVTDGGMAGSNQLLLELIDELVATEHSGK